MASTEFNVTEMKAKIDNEKATSFTTADDAAEWDTNIDPEYTILIEDCPIKSINGTYEVIARHVKDQKYKFEHRVHRDIVIYFLAPSAPSKTPRNTNNPYANKLSNQNSLDNNSINNDNIDFDSFSDPLDLLYFHWVISLRGEIYYYALELPDENDLVGAYPPGENWNLNYNNIQLIENHFNSQKDNNNNEKNSKENKENNDERNENSKNNDRSNTNTNTNNINTELKKGLKLRPIPVEVSGESKHMQYHAIDFDIDCNEENAQILKGIKKEGDGKKGRDSHGNTSDDDFMISLIDNDPVVKFHPKGHQRVYSLDSEYFANEYEFIHHSDIPLENDPSMGDQDTQHPQQQQQQGQFQRHQQGRESVELTEDHGDGIMSAMMNGMGPDDLDGTMDNFEQRINDLYSDETLPYFDANVMSENQYEEDLPVQVNDLVFELSPNQPLGFLIHIDDRQLLEVSDILENCPAYEVGLQRGMYNT